MSRDLTTYVWLSDEHGNPVGFGPGDEVPDWAAEKIGDHCYAEPKDGESDSDEPAKKAPSRRTQK